MHAWTIDSIIHAGQTASVCSAGRVVGGRVVGGRVVGEAVIWKSYPSVVFCVIIMNSTGRYTRRSIDRYLEHTHLLHDDDTSRRTPPVATSAVGFIVEYRRNGGCCIRPAVDNHPLCIFWLLRNCTSWDAKNLSVVRVVHTSSAVYISLQCTPSYHVHTF